MRSESDAGPSASDQTVVVRFESPVEGMDPITGDRFTSDRHVVLCAEIHQTHEWTRFITEAGSEAARWPTATVQSMRWPAPATPSTDDHGRAPLGAVESIEEPTAPDPEAEIRERELMDRILEERLAARRLWASPSVEPIRPELAGWDDISEKPLALGNQTTRARHSGAAPRSARQQCPVCGDRLLAGHDHPCIG